MQDLLDAIAGGLTAILLGAEGILLFLDESEIFEISLLNWFYGYVIVTSTIDFIVMKMTTDSDDSDLTVSDTVTVTEQPLDYVDDMEEENSLDELD